MTQVRFDTYLSYAIRCKSTRVIIVLPRLRLTRAGIFVVLAVLVALLGAAAKHSQFDQPPHHGYLSKAVKMAGAPANSNIETDSAQYVATPAAQVSLEISESSILVTTPEDTPTSISLLSPPLRV